MARRLSVMVWGMSVLLLAALIALPIGIDAQMLLGLTCLAGMGLLWRAERKGWPRFMFLGLGTFVVLRYVYWRTTSTLPSPSDPLDFTFGVLLYAAEMYCVVVLALSLFIIADPVPSRDAPVIDDEDLPTVDVFVPTYNEDEALLGATLAAAKSMDYPAHKLKVYLLDDGGTDQRINNPDPRIALPAQKRRAALSALAARMDVHYVARARNEHAKAGNLNAGMAVSNGDLIVIFDADHAPFRGFLRETVGFFAKDPMLFLVQTPHVFLNPDPIEKNLRTFKNMPSENEMFYGLIQRGLDRWNASFFCGSAAVLRRRALESVGGFAGVTITEDCETALELHARGWHSVYVDKPLIAGLQPETLSSFIGQRSRWCRGMIQILILKNPLFRPGLTVAQRICYVSNPLFWFFPFPRLAFIFAPLLYVFGGLQIYVANLHQMAAYTLPYLAVSLLMQNYLYGSVRWPWVSELYEYIQSLYLFQAIISVVMNPRKPTFNVTAKNVTLEEDQLSELSRPYFAMFAILLSTLAYGLWQLATDERFNELMLVVLIWNGLNLVIAGASLGAVSERRELRGAQRLDISRRGVLICGDELPVVIEDVSTTGARVRALDGSLPQRREGEMIGTLVVDHYRPDLSVRSLSVMIKRIEVDGAEDLYGLKFIQVSPAQMRLVAELMYGDFRVLEQFLKSRRKHKGLPAGSLRMLKWSARYTLRALGLSLKTARAKDAKMRQPRTLAPPPPPRPAANIFVDGQSISLTTPPETGAPAVAESGEAA